MTPARARLQARRAASIRRTRILAACTLAALAFLTIGPSII